MDSNKKLPLQFIKPLLDSYFLKVDFIAFWICCRAKDFASNCRNQAKISTLSVRVDMAADLTVNISTELRRKNETLYCYEWHIVLPSNTCHLFLVTLYIQISDLCV